MSSYPVARSGSPDDKGRRAGKVVSLPRPSCVGRGATYINCRHNQGLAVRYASSSELVMSQSSAPDAHASHNISDASLPVAPPLL